MCFVGIYGHNQNDVLESGLRCQGVEVTEVAVPTRHFADAVADRRPPILTMRSTMAWFGSVPSWSFPVLVAATFAVHFVATLAVVVANFRAVRAADVLVVPHMGDTSVLVAKPFAVAFGVPLVYYSHNGLYVPMVTNRGLFPRDSVAARTLYWLDRLLHRLSDRVVTFSDASAQRFSDLFGLPRETYETVYISVDEREFDTSVATNPSLDCDVLYWGNFLPHHGPEAMVEAAAALPEYEFVLLGDSDMREGVIRHAEAVGADNVAFPGFVDRDEMVRYARSAGVVLGPVGDNPQTEFTVGTKVAEAAYLGSAIVVADQPGTNEVFTHRQGAWLVEPGDPDALAEGVRTILSDDDLRETLEAGATEAYQRHFSSERAAIRSIEVFESCRGAG